jgi:hypothetical protein
MRDSNYSITGGRMAQEIYRAPRAMHVYPISPKMQQKLEKFQNNA